jgi:hypothetical protein
MTTVTSAGEKSTEDGWKCTFEDDPWNTTKKDLMSDRRWNNRMNGFGWKKERNDEVGRNFTNERR